MSVRHIDRGHAPRAAVRSGGASSEAEPARARGLGVAPAFAATVLRYTGSILPLLRRELAYWRAAASDIPDPVLRGLAHQALGKRGNIEGAALLGTLAPRAHRHDVVRALVCFQLAYNYLDVLGEQPSAHPTAAAHQLHQALLVALDPDASHPDYYASYPHREDAGYLSELVDACRTALIGLPSYYAVAARAQVAAARIVSFQSLNLSESQGGHYALQRWALGEIPAGSGLTWSETAAAAGSSLPVHALIALAAEPGTRVDPDTLERAYFPHLSALHSLLDSLVDRAEDDRDGQRSLLDYYPSISSAAFSLGSLAREAKLTVGLLPDGARHTVILMAMASYYLSAAECSTREGAAVSRAVTYELGTPLRVAVAIFKTRRLGFSLTRRSYS